MDHIPAVHSFRQHGINGGSNGCITEGCLSILTNEKINWDLWAFLCAFGGEGRKVMEKKEGMVVVRWWRYVCGDVLFESADV